MSNNGTRVLCRMLLVGAMGVVDMGCTATLRSTATTDAGRDTALLDAATADAIDASRALDAVRADIYTIADVAPGVGGPDAACAMQSAMAERLPLDLYVMMDSSGSMLDPTLSGATKWDAVKAAMVAFINDPQSTGIGLGIQYFPQFRANVPAECLTDAACNSFGPCFRVRVCTGTTALVVCEVNAECGTGQTCGLLGACSLEQNLCVPQPGACAAGQTCPAFSGYCLGRDTCDVASYATPAVAINVLPGAAAALIGSLNTHELDGLTPTAPALEGAIRYAQQRARAMPDRKAAVLLVTDGFPSECTPSDIPGIAAIATAGAAGAPAVPTFVIGVFAPEDAAAATTNLTALASGGGTGSAVVISTNQNVTQTLQTALGRIRTTAVACEYRIPPAVMGNIDFARVNVQFTATNGNVTTVGYVRNKGGCDPARGGWYYDADPATGGTPTSIVTCETTCSGFRTDATGRVNIVYGCQTYIIV